MSVILDRARRTLERNRESALKFVAKNGRDELMPLLRTAQSELEQRLIEVVARSGSDTFTYAQMRTTLEQIKLIISELESGMTTSLRSNARDASGRAAMNVVRFLVSTNRDFEGLGISPLNIDEAAMLSRAVKGADASLLRRLGTTKGHERQPGILKRYGMETVGHFEKVLQLGFLQKKRFERIVDDLITKSPFLQGQPRYWAERIFRTEGMAAYNKGSFESYKAADDDRDEYVKIIIAYFDDRTAADSYATHGQIRRIDETFDTWYGPIMHPPDRPNDRGSMILHHKSWPIPKSLEWRSDDEIFDAWRREGRKGRPPPRPTMTTVPMSELRAS